MTPAPQANTSETPVSESAQVRRQHLIGIVMLALMACELVDLYLQVPQASLAAKGLVLSLPVLAWRQLKLRECYLLGICLVLLAMIWTGKDNAGPVLFNALDRSAYLASFILLMGLLREGAVTSDSVLRCGTYVTLQPSRRRFLGIFAGSHLFSVLINLGSLSLLAPIIQRGVRGDRVLTEPLDEISRVRERRQLSAALRGFAWFLVWAPTAVTQAILPTLIPGIDPLRLIGLGLVVTVVMLAVGWLEDTISWLPLRRRLRATGRMPEVGNMKLPSVAARNLSLVCVTLVCPDHHVHQTWRRFHRFGHHAGRPDRGRHMDRCTTAAQPAGRAPPARGGETEHNRLLGAAGLHPRGDLHRLCRFHRHDGGAAGPGRPDRIAALDIASVAPWLFLLGLSVLVWFGGQVGLSPITMAVFLGSVVAELPDLPVDPTLAALSIAAGTAICSIGAPFASGTLMLSRASGYTGLELTWKWNAVIQRSAQWHSACCTPYSQLQAFRRDVLGRRLIALGS